MRIFAGPNGSGKSSVIEFVKRQKVNGRPIDFGIYINADDIARKLREDKFSFRPYSLNPSRKEFEETVLTSGLINNEFNRDNFKSCFSFSKHGIKLKSKSATNAGVSNPDERLAQMLADFIRKKLLESSKRFSFETVFSHESKLQIIDQAVNAGYKVYLYFVSTDSPDINKFRVKARKEKGGHDVPIDKIESRYYRSMELLHEASQHVYQAFYFDNSVDDEDFRLFAHFKRSGDSKVWDDYDETLIPNWFIKYYYNKQEG